MSFLAMLAVLIEVDLTPEAFLAEKCSDGIQ
jgi:hypothetical protein